MNVLDCMSNEYFLMFVMASVIIHLWSYLKVNLCCCFWKALLCISSIVDSTRAVKPYVSARVMYPWDSQ